MVAWALNDHSPCIGGGLDRGPANQFEEWTMPHHYLRGILFCVIATVSWGAMFPVMTGALARIDPFTFTSIRYLAAISVLLVVLLATEGARGVSLEGERVLPIWFFGTAGFAGFGFLVFLGQQMAGAEGALTASIMMATMPMMGLLVVWIVHKTMPPLYSVVFILISFCGVALVITKGDFSGLINHQVSYSASMLIILGALCWVLYTVGVSFYPRWSPLKYTTLSTAFGLLSVLTINAALFGTGAVPIPSASAIESVVPHLAYMALGAGAVGVLSWNAGNRIITPLNGVLFINVVPMTAFAISAIEGIVPSAIQVLGACLTGMALICNNLYLRRRVSPAAAPSGGTRALSPSE
jgi:drug/metabolite transporter (DMT)-like permease